MSVKTKQFSYYTLIYSDQCSHLDCYSHNVLCIILSSLLQVSVICGNILIDFNGMSTCLCQEVKESHILFVYIYIFCAVVSSDFSTQLYDDPVGWGCRIHWLHLCRGVRLPQRMSWYDTKQSDGEAPVMLELWGMWSTPSLLSLPSPL